MPKASNHVTIVRQWELLRKLPGRGPGITAGALVSSLRDAGFSVTKRTVERDLAQLSRIFSICCNDASVPFGWHWRAGARPDVSAPDLSDCVSLVVAEQMLRSVLPASMLAALDPKFSLARGKLQSTGTSFGQWVRRVRYVPTASPLLPPRINSSVLEAVHQSLLTQRQLSASYLAPMNRTSSRLTLNPLGFIQRGTTPYLIATAFDYGDVRLYAVHRLQRAVVTNQPAVAPGAFDLDEYLRQGAMQFASGGTVRLRMWVSPELGVHLAETPVAAEQTLTPAADGYIARVTVTDSWQLRWWILSQGDAVRVLVPATIRRAVETTLRRTLARYADDGASHATYNVAPG